VTTYYAALVLAITFAHASNGALRADSDNQWQVSETRSTRTLAARFALLSSLVLIAVGALRWRVGTDYWTYEALYPAYRDFAVTDYTFLNEPGMRFLAKASVIVKDDYATMLALAAIVTLGLSLRTVYLHSPDFALGITLFALTGPWLGSFNGVRQYLACAVIFAGHSLILERQFLRWVVVVCIAALFHVSALVALPLYFLPRTRLSLALGAAVIAGAALLTEAYGRVLGAVVIFRGDEYVSITSPYVTEQLDSLRVGVALAPLLFYALFTKKHQLSPRDNFYVYLLLVNAAVLVAASGSAYIARFAIYSGIFTCLAIPRLLGTSRRAEKALFTLVILALYFVFWHVETSTRPELANFRWIWQR
jgi:hypothetical protein